MSTNIDNIITVNKSMVEGPDCVWSIKQPKTYGSYRTLELPDFVIAKLREKKGKIFESTSDQISNSFKKAILKAKLPHFRFHDLRHPYVKPTTKKFITFFEVFRAAS